MKTKKQLVDLGLPEFKAEEILRLQDMMLEHEVHFQFKKKDNSIREAVGTLVRADMIQEDGSVWEPKGPQKEEDPKDVFFKYFDLGSKAWRQFNIFNLVAVEG